MEPLAELRALIQAHGRLGIPFLDRDGVKLVSWDSPTEPINCVYEPIFAVIVQGSKRTVLGDSVFDYGAGQYIVVSVDLPITSHIVKASPEEPYIGFAMTLKPALIAAMLLEADMPAHPPRDTAGLAISGATPDLLDPIIRLVKLLDRPTDRAVLGPMIEREILWRLLCGEQGAIMRQIGLADSALGQISRTTRWIRAHYAEPFKVEDLARLAGMSPSSFHRHFRAVTSMSPLQYQKHIRLQEARARLLTGPQDVAGIGFAVGYDSPSQFSREYRRLFGAPPGKDVTRLRAVPPQDRPAV